MDGSVLRSGNWNCLGGSVHVCVRVLEFAHAPSCLALKQKKLYFDTVASALFKVPLPTLTELEVAFDITHDFERFFPEGKSPLPVSIKNGL